MPATVDSIKSMNILFRPIGYKNQDGKATVEKIENWVRKEKPNFIKKQPYISLIGSVSTIVGLLAGVLGFKKENNIVKWFSGVLTLLGISATGMGIMWSKFTEELRTTAQSKNASQSSSTVKEKKLDSENVLSDLIEVSNAQGSNKNQKRKEFLDKYSEHTKELERFLAEIECEQVKSTKITNAVIRESTDLIVYLSHKNQIENNLSLIQKTSAARRDAAIELTQIDTYYDNKLVKVIISRIQDPSEDDEIKACGFKILTNQLNLNSELKNEVLMLCVDTANRKKQNIKVKSSAINCLGFVGNYENISLLMEFREEHREDPAIKKVIESSLEEIFKKQNNDKDVLGERVRYFNTKVDDFITDGTHTVDGNLDYYKIALLSMDIPSVELKNVLKLLPTPINQQSFESLFLKSK